MAFAAIFPVNLLLIMTTGGQLFTGNSATAVTAAKYKDMVMWRELAKSFIISIIGNVIGCSLFAVAARYTGLNNPRTASLCTSTALNKCHGTLGQTIVKAISCNWIVSLAVFLAGASNNLVGKLIGIWFPISTFVAIGLEHSVANLFIMPAVLLLKVPLTISDVLLSNVIPVLIGNAIAAPSSLQAATHISLANSAENAWRHSTSSKQHKRNELPCIKSRLLMVTKRQ